MSSSGEGAIGSHQDVVSYGDQCAVQKHQVEVAVETFAYADVAAIIDIKWGFQNNVGLAAAKNGG